MIAWAITLATGWLPSTSAAVAETVLPAPAGMMPAAHLPAGTVVRIRIEQPVSSRTARRGDRFPIALAEDLVHDGQVVLAAGLTGEGEVVHAQGKGFGGRAGELILAARFLERNGVRLPLRGFRLGLAGANNTAEAMVATMAFTPAGLFVTGTSAEVSAGRVGEAKLAEPLALPAISPTP
jgi:hypothetical protein